MLSKYSVFKENIILERMINESILYLAPPFVNALKLMKNNIAKEILKVQGVDTKSDITFVDVDMDKEGYLSFSTMKNALKLITSKYPNFGEGGLGDMSKNYNLAAFRAIYDEDKQESKSGLLTKSRNIVKVGKFINTLLPGKYSAKDIEDFVNQFKAIAYDKGEVFKIVQGDLIPKWYSSTMYKEQKGTLGNSCMRYSSDYIFEIYSSNPEVCRLLILVDNNQLIGRALVWKIDGIKNCEYFMDRQYVIQDSYVEKFRNYAVEQGWAYKANNSHTSQASVIFKERKFDANMTVQLKDNTYDYYPYMDTFVLFNPITNILSNEEDANSNSKNLGSYILNNTDGDYTVITDDVYSHHYDGYYDRDEATWSDAMNDWIPNHSVIYVEVGANQGVYADDHMDIVYDELYDRYLHIDDCVYSDKYDSRILKSDAVKVVEDINDDASIGSDDSYYYKDDSDIVLIQKESLWYVSLCDYDYDWKYRDYILKDLVRNDYNGNQILNMFSISVYRVITEFDADNFYLYKDDADNFGYKVDMDDERIMDWFNYYKEIKEFKNKLSLFRNKPILTLKKIIKNLEKNNDSDSDNDRLQFISAFDIEEI